MLSRSKVAALVAEFFGTLILSLTILSVVNSIGLPFFTAVTAGLTLGVIVLVMGGASGAHINPAVTLGLWVLRKIQSAQAIAYVAAQLLGGLVALWIGERLIDLKIEHSAAWGLDKRFLMAEILGTFIFTFGVAAAIYNVYEGTKLAVTIGGSLMLGIFVASLASRGILNPAVAVGLNSVSWAYIMGPLIGGILGMSTYALLFSPAPAKKSRIK